MSAQLGAPAILSLWAANRDQRLTKPGTCTGCEHLLHLPGNGVARCAREGLRKIAERWADGDARPHWCSLREGA